MVSGEFFEDYQFLWIHSSVGGTGCEETFSIHDAWYYDCISTNTAINIGEILCLGAVLPTVASGASRGTLNGLWYRGAVEVLTLPFPTKYRSRAQRMVLAIVRQAAL